MDIKSITSETLKTGILKSILPEYYELKALTENNPWHQEQNVFEHVVAVFEGLEKVLALKLAPRGLLKLQIEKHSRQEILVVATILHDIAKKQTLIRNRQTHLTACPAHEVIGGFLAEKYAKRFGLPNKEVRRVQKIVHYHGFVNGILTLCLNRREKSSYFKLFKEIVGDIWPELLLLMYADILGSDLQKMKPEEFKQRTALITEFLRK